MGVSPWTSELDDKWNFLRSCNYHQAGEIGSIDEGKRELDGMFEYWKKTVLCAEEIEVFNTATMGLGVRVSEQLYKSSIFFRPLSLHALHGFLEVIPESLFDELRNCGNNSLYKFYDRSSRKWVYSILFGPLSLVNSKQNGNGIGFCGLDTQLRTLVWRLTYSHGLMLFGENNDAVHLVDSFECEYYDEDEDDVYTSEKKPRRLKYGAVVPVRIDQGNSLACKRSFFLRIVMRHKKPEEEVNIMYLPGQEIFIDYDYV